MQNWEKLDIIYNAAGIAGFTHAAVPLSMFISPDQVRIFFCSRDNQSRAHPFYLDFDLISMSIIDISDKPLMNLGKLGTFDDSGVMPSCLIKFNNELRLYYTGWNLGVTVPFRNSIGLAISYDNGEHFERVFEGPLIDRIKTEPYFCATPFILIEDGVWKIWYLNCVKWEIVNARPKHYYHIKYAESIDGINFERNGIIAIDFKGSNEFAISVPCIKKEDNIYKMWYSYRGSNISDTYRIGYAESEDGKEWLRKDELVNFNVSDEGWDSTMISYPNIFDYKGDRYMIYNGNNYGQTGFGLARLIKEV